MFNVAVLKMKDIIKYGLGLTIMILVIITISKYFPKNTNEKELVNEVKNGVKMFSENSMLDCLEQTIPTIASINEEYKNISNEDDKIQNQNILQEILKTQISSIKSIEIIEEAKNNSTTEETTNTNKPNENEVNNNVELAEGRIKNRSNNKQPNKRKF